MMKLGGASIMQQGCFSSAGTGAVVKIEAITGSSKYQNILPQNLQASIKNLKLKRNFIIQQDNNLEHKSKSIKETASEEEK